MSKAVIGLTVEKDGEPVNVHALNGVVLSRGGFEKQQDDGRGLPGPFQFTVSGTLFNTGDGNKLASEVGADFWHMEAYEGNCFHFGGVSFPIKETEHSPAQRHEQPVSGQRQLRGGRRRRPALYDRRRRGPSRTHARERRMGYDQRPHTTWWVWDSAHNELIEKMNGLAGWGDETLQTANTIAELEVALGIQSRAAVDHRRLQLLRQRRLRPSTSGVRPNPCVPSRKPAPTTPSSCARPSSTRRRRAPQR